MGLCLYRAIYDAIQGLKNMESGSTLNGFNIDFIRVNYFQGLVPGLVEAWNNSIGFQGYHKV